MTEASYRENVRLGVTGPHASNCLMAAYDRISFRTSLSARTYSEYEVLRWKFVDVVGDDGNHMPDDLVREWGALRRRFWRELGVHTPRNISSVRARTQPEFTVMLDRLLHGGFRPVVYLNARGGLHAVGVLPTQRRGMYRVRSTWTPFEDENRVNSAELFGYLEMSHRTRRRAGNARKTYAQSNIIALPPERM